MQEVPNCIYNCFLDTYLVLRIRIRTGIDLSHFENRRSSDPDLDPHRSQKLNTDPQQYQKPEAAECGGSQGGMETQSGATETHPGAVEAHNGAVEAQKISRVRIPIRLESKKPDPYSQLCVYT